MKFQEEIKVKDQPSMKYALLHYFKNESSLILLEGDDLDNTSFSWMLAAGSMEEVRSGTDGAFKKLQDFHSKHKDWIFGHLNYDLKNDIEHLKSNNWDGIQAPEMSFFLPKYMFRCHGNKLSIYRHDSQNYFKCSHLSIYDAQESFHIQLKWKPRISSEEYLLQVQEIKNLIQRGSLYEMNYCQEFYADLVEIQPLSIYRKLNRHSGAPFSCYYKIQDIHLMCSSPERFLKKTGNMLLSQPIKGTKRRGTSSKEDQVLIKELQTDPKERAENVMIVDLVRNDLSRIALSNSVKVDELFGIYTFPQVHQMISSVSCEISTKTDLKEILRATFPMGSMTGAPKISAMKHIENFEKTKRGLYSGSVGYIDPDGDFDFNVIIRSLQYNAVNKYLSLMVGGAITIGSKALSEYEECLLKASALFDVLKENHEESVS
jgi:para-aminobenzoate synthetase component 1